MGDATGGVVTSWGARPDYGTDDPREAQVRTPNPANDPGHKLMLVIGICLGSIPELAGPVVKLRWAMQIGDRRVAAATARVPGRGAVEQGHQSGHVRKRRCYGATQPSLLPRWDERLISVVRRLKIRGSVLASGQQSVRTCYPSTLPSRSAKFLTDMTA